MVIHGLAYFLGASGTVIVADDRRGTFCDGVNRCFDHLTDTGDDSHNGYVDITACNGQDIVGADSDKTVGQLHNKSGSSEADDIFGIFTAGCQFGFGKKTDPIFCFVV